MRTKVAQRSGQLPGSIAFCPAVFRRFHSGPIAPSAVPRLGDCARAIEQTDEAIRGGRKRVVLVTRRIAHNVPALTAIMLPRDLRAGPKACAKIRNAIPRLMKCRS